ncbi:DEAD-box ATP-dependent RNA helicase 14-like protein [Tanacetum coccineum]
MYLCSILKIGLLTWLLLEPVMHQKIRLFPSDEERPSMPKEVAPEPDVTEKQSSDAPIAPFKKKDAPIAATTNGGSDHSYEPPKETVAFKTQETPARVHVPSAGSGIILCNIYTLYHLFVRGLHRCWITLIRWTNFEKWLSESSMVVVVLKAGFAAPTHTMIQAQSWPIPLRSRDIVAVAKTDSGKTPGYLIPGFRHLKVTCNNPKTGPTVLVLSPTSELATTIQNEAVKFGES